MKDRFSDAYGPKRSQPTALALHSDGETKTFLAMAGHEDLAVAITSVHAEAAIEKLLDAVH